MSIRSPLKDGLYIRPARPDRRWIRRVIEYYPYIVGGLISLIVATSLVSTSVWLALGVLAGYWSYFFLKHFIRANKPLGISYQHPAFQIVRAFVLIFGVTALLYYIYYRTDYLRTVQDDTLWLLYLVAISAIGQRTSRGVFFAVLGLSIASLFFVHPVAGMRVLLPTQRAVTMEFVAKSEWLVFLSLTSYILLRYMSDAVADLNLVIRVQQKMREMEGALSGGQRGASADSNLEKAVELIRDDFSYDHVNLFVLDKHNRELIYTAAACARGKELVRSGYCVSVVDQDSIIGQVARTGQPYVANDVRKDLHYLLHQAFPDTRAELAVPIKVRDRLYGVLDIQVQDAVYFLEQEIKAVEILSNHIGWVVDSAQQYDHIGWLNSSIEKIADPIFTQGHLDETLQEIADSALEELKADLVILYSNDPGAGDGVSGPIYSGDLLHPELINAGPVDPDNVVFRLITSDERIYVNEDLDKIDLNSYPLFRPSATHVSTGKLTFIEREAIKANVIIRLLSNGQCVGILFLNFRQPRLYTEWEIQRYHSFAHLAALAIQKMQLQQHVIQKEKNELANLVHDILIGDTLGLFKILRAIELPAPAGTDNGASQRLELAIDATEHLHNDIRWINRLLKDDHSDDLMLEIDRLFMMFRQVFNVKTETRWSGDTRLIPRELTRELFIVISEALTNAVRHGKAKNIVVAGAVRGKHLSATIGDDGVGFNPKHVKRMNGLLSMKYRIEEMGGKFKLTSDLGRGTKIALRVPIQR